MDPVPIDNRNDSCDEILAPASKLATIFKNAAGLYSDLAPTFTEFHESCMKFAEAVRAIQSWLTDGPEKQLLDSAPWYQLSRSLGRAEKAINVLHDEVQTVLRSRYESRSRSRVVPEWNLEGLQNYGEDVQHETQTLQQILQYMKLLLISDTSSNSTIRAEDQHGVEGLGPRRASLPVIAGGSQADTVNTLDKPAPPYRLVDV
jgi:oligoribonuclease NrnB/cAMP/cGMP phosphodiesterase (DHH superfamily)